MCVCLKTSVSSLRDARIAGRDVAFLFLDPETNLDPKHEINVHFCCCPHLHPHSVIDPGVQVMYK